MESSLSVFRTAKILRSQLFPIVSEQEAENIMRILVEHASGLPWHHFLIHPDLSFSASEHEIFSAGAEKLLAGIPLQYVIGEAWFMGRPFQVGPGVLIPRPETEELVDWILKSGKAARIQDLCTGSGCIGISLSLAWPDALVELVEVSDDAARWVNQNLVAFPCNALLRMADILVDDPCAPFQPDMIVSNPPYVLESDKAEMAAGVLDHEPGLALFVPDMDPLRFYHRIADLARGSLAPDGWLYFEIHERFGQDVCAAMVERGFVEVELKKDMQGKDRMVRGKIGNYKL